MRVSLAGSGWWWRAVCPLVVLAAFALACSAAHAFDATPAHPDELGFDSVGVTIPVQGVARGRRTPVEVTISGGREPLRGRVIVEVPCDQMRDCQIWTRFEHDGAAGSTVVPLIVDAGLTLSFDAYVRVRLIDDEGRTRFDARGRLTRDNLGRLHVMDLRRVTGSAARHTARYYGSHPSSMIWYVAEPGVTDAEHPFARFGRANNLGGVSRGSTALVSAGALPEVWAGYDGADVVAVMASEAHLAAPEARQALDLWVQSGGRLLVFPDLAGPGVHDWRRWLPSLDETSPAPTLTRGTRDGPLAGRVRDLLSDEDRPLPPFVELALDDHAAEHGWRVRWTDTTAPAPRTGLIAEGPHGLGRVLIVGLRPSTWTRFESIDGTSLLARHASDRVAHTILGQDLDQYAVGLPEPAGRGLIIGMLVMIVLLALLLGYVDGFIVRKSRWPTAARWTPWAWIGLFSLAALVLPPLLRTGEQLMIRTAYTELIADPDPARGSEGWQQAVTLINTNRRTTLHFETDNDPAWWGGVSMSYFAHPQIAASPALSIEQPRHHDGSGIPGPIRIRPMAVRLFSDESRLRTSLSAQLTGTPDEPGVRLTGLPEDARIVHAAIHMPDGWHELADPAPTPGSPGTPGTAAAPDTVDARADTRTLPWSRSVIAPGWIRPHHQPWVTTRRVRAMDDRRTAGGWAVLHISVEGWPGDVRTEPALPSTHRATVRVLIPFPEAWADTDNSRESQEEAR